MNKIKIIFLVSDFYHNGAQREMYEFDTSLDRSKFDITILSLTPLNTRADLTDYFYEKHLELGSKVIFLDDYFNKPNKSLAYKVLNKVSRSFFKKKTSLKNNKSVAALLNDFDKVVFMGEYVYQYLATFIPHDFFQTVIIFVMCFRFQSENYRNFSKDNKYSFISVFDDLEQVEFEFQGFKDYTYQHMPLSLNISDIYKKWNFKDNNEIKRIGIFTRLHKDKPLDPFLYAYQILISQGVNVELHIFGIGDFKQAEYDRYINHLGLKDKVYFRGHQSDMKQTILDEKLDLIWFQGYNNIPGGYAGLDACLTGTPQIFWDFFVGENGQINKLDVVYPHYKDVLLFVEASKAILYDEKIAKSISDRQFQNVVDNRDIAKNIKTVEEILSK
ncbi:glycosyltransferase family protein [Flavobacterium collinsii]|uniref:Uncharacterized protein n=1 Tax=Flavobacterium collinsii TaxID=1114861 RepID=A0A9W4TDB9_9FLAO|nr:hypothetical protein [Flavobacterium collinsii]CAI2765399.1 conserved protein of unknown function [Flavobacterium collinsii]